MVVQRRKKSTRYFIFSVDESSHVYDYMALICEEINARLEYRLCRINGKMKVFGSIVLRKQRASVGQMNRTFSMSPGGIVPNRSAELNEFVFAKLKHDEADQWFEHLRVSCDEFGPKHSNFKHHPYFDVKRTLFTE